MHYSVTLRFYVKTLLHHPTLQNPLFVQSVAKIIKREEQTVNTMLAFVLKWDHWPF